MERIQDARTQIGKKKGLTRRCGEPRAAARQVLDLFHDSNGELEDGDGFVIGLCDAFVDQAQRSGAGTFGAKEKSANTGRAQPQLIADEKSVTFGREKNFVDAVNDPAVTGGWIFLELDRYFRTARRLNEGAVVLFAENEVRHG